MDAVQERYYEIVPYVLAGQFLVPRVWRGNVAGIVNASEFVFWGVGKR